VGNCERDSLTSIGVNVLLRHFDETFDVSSGSQQRSQTELRNTLPP
jgi:hypothetical protein